MSEVVRPDDPLVWTVDDEQPTSVGVCRLVAAVSDTPIRNLPPLESVIDTAALDELFTDAPAGTRLTFPYAGYRIVVTDGPRVEVHQPRS